MDKVYTEEEIRQLLKDRYHAYEVDLFRAEENFIREKLNLLEEYARDRDAINLLPVGGKHG